MHEYEILPCGDTAVLIRFEQRIDPQILHQVTMTADAIKEANLPYIRMHDFRHSHASYLISKGVNMYTVSRRLGHASIQMTIDRYTHLMPDAQDEVIKAITG